MAVATVYSVREQLMPVFKQYDVHRAVLFGSVAKGTNTEKSDIDILVDSRLKGLHFVGLLEDLQQAAGMQIDLIDVAHIEKGSPVETEIAQTGVVIYEK